MANSDRKSGGISSSKSSTTSSISAKPSKKIATKPSRIGIAANPGNLVETIINEGDLITFSPTGERIRVTRIQKERVTLEKSP